MADLISDALETVNQTSDYKAFRRTVYDDGRFFRRILCDSRETIPLTLALFRLAEGDVEKMVTYAANFGRDADTIGTMGGAIAGAYQGITGIRADWADKARRATDVDQDELTERLILTSRAKFDSQQAARREYLKMWGAKLP
jgi:hypothetical protein